MNTYLVFVVSGFSPRLGRNLPVIAIEQQLRLASIAAHRRRN
jgi:hypothetical protein